MRVAALVESSLGETEASAVTHRSVAGVVALTAVIFVCVTVLSVVSVLADADLAPVAVLVGLAAPTVTSLLAALRMGEVRAEVRGIAAGVRARDGGGLNG